MNKAGWLRLPRLIFLLFGGVGCCGLQIRNNGLVGLIGLMGLIGLI